MLILNEISINNFLSHENTSLSFKEDQKLLLDGKSGSGKSSVLDAILWCLYGEARVDNRNLVRKGTKKATVSLKLTNGSKKTVITRSTTDKGKNELMVTESVDGAPFIHIDKTGLKDIQTWIENELLHASYSLFTNSIAYPQDNQNNFVRSSAVERKNLLLEIIRAGDLDAYYEKAKDVLSKEENHSIVLFSKIQNLEKETKELEPVAVKEEEYQKEINKWSLELSSLAAQEKTIEARLNEIKTINQQISDKNILKTRLLSNLAAKNSEILKNKEKINQNLSLDFETAKKKIGEAQLVREKIAILEERLKINAENQFKINTFLANKPPSFDYTGDIEKISKQLIPLIKESGKCPSGDSCPFTLPIKGQISFLEEQMLEKEKKMKENKEALLVWSNAFALLPQAEDTKGIYEECQELKKELKELSFYEAILLKCEIASKENQELNEKNDQLNKEIISENTELEEIEKQITILKATLMSWSATDLNSQLNKIRIDLTEAKIKENGAIRNHATAIQAKNKLIEICKELENLQKEATEIKNRLDCLRVVKEAFGNKGIKPMIIDYLVPELENRINEILNELSCFQIRLDTQQEKTNEEGMKEGLFITVINEKGEELPFDSFSGGEKVKITIAISEALASLMNQIGFRMMDENIISLDKDSTENFVSALERLQNKFSQMLVISHLQEIKDIFEHKITVTKINGISKI